MKWIGQHIWDFISRFRSDVYMEAVESGTIASGGNLGLDANNKVVKADTETGELTLASGANDRVVTALGLTMLNAESTLEYSSATKIMKIGADDNSTAQIGRQLHTSDHGGQLTIFGGSPTFVPSSTNKNGGNLLLQGGFATGSGTGGSVVIGTTKGTAGGPTTMNLQSATVTVSGANVHLEEDVTLSFEGATNNGNETRVTVVDPTAARTITLPDATGTVALTSDITSDGWHGSTTRIKILHSDFMADDIGRPYMIDDTGVASEELFGETHSTGFAYATVVIPTGYKATSVAIYGDGARAVEVWEHQINSKTGVSKGTGNVDTPFPITNVTSSTTNYLFIQVAQQSGDEIHGGYVVIEAV